MPAYLQAMCCPSSFPQWWGCGRNFRWEFRSTNCGRQVTQRRQSKRLFFLSFGDPLAYEPHLYMCHRISNNPVFKKSVSWARME